MNLERQRRDVVVDLGHAVLVQAGEGGRAVERGCELVAGHLGLYGRVVQVGRQHDRGVDEQVHALSHLLGVAAGEAEPVGDAGEGGGVAAGDGADDESLPQVATSEVVPPEYYMADLY